jgi:hypothetical protein
MRHSRFVFAALVAAALCACERSQPAASTASASPEEVGEQQSELAATEPEEPVVIPPFDPSLPALELEPVPAPKPQIAGAPPAKRSARKSERTTTTTAAAEPAHPSLDALLRAQYERPEQSTAIDLGSSGQQIEPKPPRALDPLGPSLRLERRGESIGPAGPRQGTYWETDAGVRLPVDKTVSLEGGVRVDSREEPGVKEPERRPTPRVGVEVKF